MDELVGPQTSLDRKNRFLNHLLARFAEQFTDYSLFLFEAMPKGIDPAEKMIHDKQAYPEAVSGCQQRPGHGFQLPAAMVPGKRFRTWKSEFGSNWG